MATININAGANDIININRSNDNNTQQKAIGKEELYKKLQRDIKRVLEMLKTELWYEVFIDFDECFDGIYEQVKSLPYVAAFDLCLGFMYRREAYYGSPKYLNDLDELVKSAE